MSYIPSYRVLDAVRVEDRIGRGFHRTAVVLAFLLGPAISWLFGYLGESDTPEVVGLIIAIVAGLIVYGAVRTIGWAISGFSRQ